MGRGKSFQWGGGGGHRGLEAMYGLGGGGGGGTLASPVDKLKKTPDLCC